VDVVIPDETFWGAATVLGAIVGWLTRLEARLNARLTRQEHADICGDSQGRLGKQLEDIHSEILRNREESTRGRHDMQNKLVELSLRVERLSALTEDQKK
jgi:hypothetical protein